MTSDLKHPHQLFRAASGPDLVAMAEAAGVGLAALIDTLVQPHPGGERPPTLVVGSIADGTATASSDLDLLVLVDSFDRLRPPAGQVWLDSGSTLEVLQYLNGVEVNVSFVSRSSLAPVTDSLVRVAPALYDPRTLGAIPLIHEGDLRVAHRLRTGWPLWGDDQVERWRDECLAALLPQYLTIRHLVELAEFSEDAEALIGSVPGSMGLAARIAVQHGVLALLAHQGFTGQNHKWIIHWAGRVERPSVRALAVRGCEMVLAAAPLTEHDERRCLGELRSFRAQVSEELSTDPELRSAIEHFAEAIEYVTKEAP